MCGWLTQKPHLTEATIVAISVVHVIPRRDLGARVIQQRLSGSHEPRNNTIERVVVGGKRRSCVLSESGFAEARPYGRLSGDRNYITRGNCYRNRKYGSRLSRDRAK